MKLVKNFLSLAGAEVISKLVTFAAFAYLARVAGPDGFGYLESATAHAGAGGWNRPRAVVVRSDRLCGDDRFRFIVRSHADCYSTASYLWREPALRPFAVAMGV